MLASPGVARIGLGAGIIADSVAADEWRECLAKGAFLARRPPPDIIETMRVEAGSVGHRDRHLARAAASAQFLGYSIDALAIAAMIDRAAAGATGRLRLVIAPTGAAAVTVAPLPVPPSDTVTVAVVALPVAPGDWRLRHKTSDRAFYDAARTAAGTFEVVFVTPDGSLTEGSFTSVFVPRGDGVLLTPPLETGLLPGVLRAALLASGVAVEAPLTAADLVDGLLVGNALRGLIRARLR